jgi:Tol biopolymer transport system component
MLTNGSAFVRQGSWSRDGRYLVYSAGDGLQQDIWVAGDKPYNLTKGGPGSWSWPVFSYDGSTIFAIQRSVRPELVRLDGNTNHWQTEWQGAAAFELDYSRDATWVVYTRFPDHTLWKSHRDGTGRSQLTDAQLEAHQAHWSPDGTRIAFMAKNAKGQWRIWQVAANGGKPEQLLENGEDQGTPTWSADGSKLIFGDFLGRRPGAEMCIHQLDLKTRKLTDVPGSKGLWSPRWSPNGLWVAAIAFRFRRAGWNAWRI